MRHRRASPSAVLRRRRLEHRGCRRRGRSTYGGSNFTAEAIGATSAATARRGHYTAAVPWHGLRNSTSIRINNMAFTGGGSDHAFDNLHLLTGRHADPEQTFRRRRRRPIAAVTLPFTVILRRTTCEAGLVVHRQPAFRPLTIADSAVSLDLQRNDGNGRSGKATVTITDGNLPARSVVHDHGQRRRFRPPAASPTAPPNISGAGGMNPPPAPATGRRATACLRHPTIFIAQGTSTAQAWFPDRGSSFVISSPSATRWRHRLQRRTIPSTA